MPDRFQTAYKRAREKAGLDTWPLLSDREQAEAVAAELRILDAEGVEEQGKGDDGKGDA